MADKVGQTLISNHYAYTRVAYQSSTLVIVIWQKETIIHLLKTNTPHLPVLRIWFWHYEQIALVIKKNKKKNFESRHHNGQY